MRVTALPAALAAYARRFHEAALATGPAHHVASPVGAWILLALAADALEGGARAAAAAVLGMPVDEARAAAQALVEDPHEAVAAAAACWSDPARLGARLAAWAERLPAGVERGPVPTPAAADRWAAERTQGLIERFPLEVDPATVLVLATALATRISWEVPHELAPAADLGGPWAAAVGQVLTRSQGVHLDETEAAGLVVSVRVGSATGLDVVTVAADPDVAPVDVIAAAHELAGRGPHAPHLSLFDVPAGPGHSWDLDETVEELATPLDRLERTRVVLPAWRAASDHALLADDRFGFTALAARLLAALPHHPDGWEADAAQSAVAAYGRVGFEAAAVTALAMRAGMALPPEPRPVPVRTLRARLARPHAVVAVAGQGRWDVVPAQVGPWDRVPVFSAWVAEPAEADDGG